MAKIIQAHLRNCVRCRRFHGNLKFFPFAEVNSWFTHWTQCPKNKEPVMLSADESEHGKVKLYIEGEKEPRLITLKG